MIKLDNLKCLKERFPDVLHFTNQVQPHLDMSSIIPAQSKTDCPTLQMNVNDKTLYLHSKYDPTKEAAQWVAQVEEELESAEHVFVYGIGYGYHIDLLLERYPDKLYTLYEPDPSVFYSALCQRTLPFLQSRSVKHLLVEYVPAAMEASLRLFLANMKESFYLFLHPAYERLNPERTAHFMQTFKEVANTIRQERATTEYYEHIWTVNSLGNFAKVLQTPNVFHLPKSQFQNKPVIIVAAGPSLQEELERLRYIKDNRLAYIFSVGSANKALLANNIRPDAVLTYDPNIYNHQVFEDMINQGIDDIPMIFGSSVGYQILNDYRGPKLHMIINQDTIAPYYLKDDQMVERGEIIQDAPTIAIITLNLVNRLGCSPVILVGQNFGYKNNQYYAQGISHWYRPTEVQDFEKPGIIETEGADGGMVQTTEAHNMGRHSMERFLEQVPNLKVINTTKGGARIKGTTFMPLEQVMNEILTESFVEPDWYLRAEREYSFASIHKQASRLQEQYKRFPKDFEYVEKDLKKLDTLVAYNESAQINRFLPKFDTHVNAFLKNDYFHHVIRPMMRSYMDLLNKNLDDIQRTTDTLEKASKVVNAFGGFMYRAFQLFQNVNSVYYNLHGIIMSTENKKQNVEV